MYTVDYVLIYCVALHHRPSLHCTALMCTALHCTDVHCNVVHVVHDSALQEATITVALMAWDTGTLGEATAAASVPESLKPA